MNFKKNYLILVGFRDFLVLSFFKKKQKQKQKPKRVKTKRFAFGLHLECFFFFFFFPYQRMAGSPATPRMSLKNIDKAVTTDTFLGEGKSTHY